MRTVRPVDLKKRALQQIVGLVYKTIKEAVRKRNEGFSNLQCQTSRKRKRTSSGDDNLDLRAKKMKTDNEFRSSTPSSSDQKLSRGDESLKNCKLVDPVIILRRYLSCIPGSVWTDFFSLMMKHFRQQYEDGRTHLDTVQSAFEIIFSTKVVKYSSTLFPYINSTCEEAIYERLKLCQRLNTLTMLDYPHSKSSEQILVTSLTKLHYLRIVKLLPSSRDSYHWAIPILSSNCKLLTELSIIYSSDAFEHEDGICSLRYCEKLTSLVLYAYGLKSELKALLILLDKLPRLKYIFHKELPNALSHRYDLTFRTTEFSYLNLQSVVLVDFVQSLGTQLIYVPDSFLTHISIMCPHLSHLAVIQPSCLLEVTKHALHLKSFELHQSEFTIVMNRSLIENRFVNLRTLHLMNMERVSYQDIEYISHNCVRLEELEICNSNLVHSGFLFNIVTKPTFPHLRKLVILNSQQLYPLGFYKPSQFDVGKNLLTYLIKQNKSIEFLKLELDHAYQLHDPLEWNEFRALIGHCKNLRELLFLSTSYHITANMITQLIKSHNRLNRLCDLKYWNITNEEYQKCLRQYRLHLNYC